MIAICACGFDGGSIDQTSRIFIPFLRTVQELMTTISAAVRLSTNRILPLAQGSGGAPSLPDLTEQPTGEKKNPFS